MYHMIRQENFMLILTKAFQLIGKNKQAKKLQLNNHMVVPEHSPVQ